MELNDAVSTAREVLVQRIEWDPSSGENLGAADLAGIHSTAGHVSQFVMSIAFSGISLSRYGSAKSATAVSA